MSLKEMEGAIQSTRVMAGCIAKNLKDCLAVEVVRDIVAKYTVVPGFRRSAVLDIPTEYSYLQLSGRGLLAPGRPRSWADTAQQGTKEMCWSWVLSMKILHP